jgi:hypothetical protein
MDDKIKAQMNDAQAYYLQLLIDSGCKFLFRTEHFGKPYVWMKDKYGSTFMERLPDDA